MRKSITALIVVLAIPTVAIVTVAPTSAGCIPSKYFGSVESHYPYTYTYIDFADDTGDSSHFIGRQWQTGDRGAANEGVYDVTAWLFGYPGVVDYWYLDGDLGDDRFHGCPAGHLTVYAEDTLTDKYVLWTVIEGSGPSGEMQFDYSVVSAPLGFFVAADSPRPRVTDSMRVGDTVIVDYTITDPTPGVFTDDDGVGAITATLLYSRAICGYPSLDLPGDWTLQQVQPSTGGSGTVVLDCSDPCLDQWIATALEVEGEEPGFVGEPVQVECGPVPCDWDPDSDGISYCEGDNCAEDYNPGQSDSDGDGEGDVCDLDDGLIFVRFFTPDRVSWQAEEGFDPVNPWNCYRGDLDVLESTGVYTQQPGSNDLARRHCGLDDPWVDDADTPEAGKCAYYLVTGMQSGIECSLGHGDGEERPNDNPCP